METQIVGDLPQVVWLRGDEPHCDEFLLTADDVMAQLGIRRSRLTQISGRELRVGRIRRGRYVSPVYRQVDIDEYLAWTRATASHLKSSSVLSEAADELMRQGEALAERIEAVPDELARLVQVEVRAGSVMAERAAREAALGTGAEVRDAEERLRKSDDRLKALIDGLSVNLGLVRDQLGEHGAALKAVMQDAMELAALARGQHERLAVIESRLDGIEARLSVEPPAPPRPKPRRGKADGRRVRTTPGKAELRPPPRVIGARRSRARVPDA